MAKLDEYQKAEAYRYYCTTALKCIADNTKAMYGGSSPDKSFWDIMHPSEVKKPEKSQEEIITDLNVKAGLKMID